MAKLFATKPLNVLMSEASETGEHSLRRALGPINLLTLGIGAIIGAGIFVITGQAAAQFAGPAIILSFILAGIACAFAGLCYAEFASMIPIAGSAYTYSYATLGELVAWIIGWDLILEYAFGAATVAVGWSGHLRAFLHDIGFGLPPIPHSDFVMFGRNIHLTYDYIGFLVIMAITTILVIGIKESANFTTAIVILKVAVVCVFIGLATVFLFKDHWQTNHWQPFIPPNTGETGHFGWSGILRGAGVVFFAYIGFDAVSTAAQEAKNPKRDMPIGILGSLVVCTVLYVLFSYVLSGVATVQDFRTAGREASVAFAITKYMHGYEWLSKSVTLAILAGFSSVILVMLLGQSRVFYSMSHDGLVPKIFSDIHPRFRTPYKSNMLFFVFTGMFAAFLPEDIVGEMTSIGTLFAFVLVCIAVWILRVRRPDLPRAFRVPAVPIVTPLGVIICAAMIYGLGWTNWLRLGVWLVIGLAIYFGYGRRHSKVQAMNGAPEPQGAPSMAD